MMRDAEAEISQGQGRFLSMFTSKSGFNKPYDTATTLHWPLNFEASACHIPEKLIYVG